MVSVVGLPDFKESFASDFFLARLFIRLDTFRRRENERAVAIADRHYFMRFLVHTSTGLRDASCAMDDVKAALVVLQDDIKHLAHFFAFLLNRLHVACVAKLFGYRCLKKRVG